MKRVFIKTFGCQMNKNDSDIISQILLGNGYELVEEPRSADVFVINTCSVRAHAEQRAMGYISSLRRWLKGDKKILAVVGCMAKNLANEIAIRFPYVDLVLGPDSYRRIPEYLKMVSDGKTRVIETEVGNELYNGICRSSRRISDFVAITRGCNNFCSYCIVPFVRGPLRSRPINEIINEVKSLIQAGVMDITLLGQNVNEYNCEGINFAGLLKMVSAIPGLFRLRFLTSHPKDFTDEILEVVTTNKNICEWFHLPLQSGNNRILRLMNRKYTIEDYLRLIEKIRKTISGATITTDVIVGFPTETEEEFEETIAVLKEVRFDDAYMYRYSPRPGTRANEYEPLPEEVIKSRLARLIEIQNRIIIEKALEMCGKTYEVLFEEYTTKGARGKTRGNKDVVVEKPVPPGSVHQVLITEVKGRTPIGRSLGSGLNL